MFLGLTVANVIGVPVATLMGQQLGWRATFLAVSAIGLGRDSRTRCCSFPPTTATARPAGCAASSRRSAPCPCWLALATTVAGFGALFAAYSYVDADAHRRRRVRGGRCHAAARPVRRRRDRRATCSAGGSPTGPCAGPCSAGSSRSVVVLALFPVLMRAEWSAAVAVVLLGAAAFITGSPLQMHGHGEGLRRALPRLLRQPGRLQPRQRRRRLDRRARPRRRVRARRPPQSPGLRSPSSGSGSPGLPTGSTCVAPGLLPPRPRRGVGSSWPRICPTPFRLRTRESPLAVGDGTGRDARRAREAGLRGSGPHPLGLGDLGAVTTAPTPATGS